jgi:hypothetical protein
MESALVAAKTGGTACCLAAMESLKADVEEWVVTACPITTELGLYSHKREQTTRERTRVDCEKPSFSVSEARMQLMYALM